MEIDIRHNSKVNITFNNTAKVVVRGNHNYLVKWFENGEYFGEMYLNSGNWGAFPMNDIANWRIEFWFENQLIHTYNNLIQNGNVLIVFDNKNGLDFKEYVNNIKKYCQLVYDTYGCIPYVFFKGSETCDLTQDKMRPLRFNDRIEHFKIIFNKTF